MLQERRHYLIRLLLAVDQFFNVLIFNGSEDETISSNFGKRSGANFIRKAIDSILGKDHCTKNIEWDE